MLTFRCEDQYRLQRTIVTYTKLNCFKAMSFLLLAEVSGHVTEIESSLMEVAIIEVVFSLKTLLRDV